MFTVTALYRFTRFENPGALRQPLIDLCRTHGITGTLLLAAEGINGTIAGSDTAIETVLSHIRTLPGCAELDHRNSRARRQPFRKLKVRLKHEIVTLNQPQVDPREVAGRYVDPKAWNDLIRRKDIVVIDVRNDYEIAVGTVEGAIDPGIRTFSQFPSWWKTNEKRFRNRHVAMFCTGGIRCEKSTSYLLRQGAKEVFHLKGGILRYLEEIPPAESVWHGECFVFDRRISVGHGLIEGRQALCRACGRPYAPGGGSRSEYGAGRRCRWCIGDHVETPPPASDGWEDR
ncbi:MAG: rhodanese-related sulfurtransferase [Pseudomonadota bacterium]